MNSAGALVESIEADLTWTGERFERGVRVAIGADGRIVSVARGAGGTGGAGGAAGAEGVRGAAARRLASRALIPGFVGVHSHAFQRGLRGDGERFPEGAGSFWSWRKAMYELVESLDAERFHALSRRAFEELRRSGVTTVGEFHYFRHGQGGEDFAFDEVILRAALDAGIRLVLLPAFYRTGGIGEPLGRGQRRFATPSVEGYWARFDELRERVAPGLQSLGAAAHSIRAASPDDIASLYEEAMRRGLVFHMHVEEQPLEIEACLAAYHRTPMSLVNERLAVSPRFTAVHCTHTSPADLYDFAAAGGNVCLCPLTEANLGDGIANVPQMRRHGARICVGTDSNSRHAFIEELRWLEYAQRLQSQTRGVCRDREGHVARELLHYGTVNGARSLGVHTGVIEQGAFADFIAIDLEAPALAGWSDDTLAESIIFGSGNEVIAETCVGGRWEERE